MTYDYYDLFTGEGITDYELHERYDDMLDECYGTATVAGMEFDTARALKELDPIAYRCGFHDWIDSELGESLSEDAPEEEDNE